MSLSSRNACLGGNQNKSTIYLSMHSSPHDLSYPSFETQLSTGTIHHVIVAKLSRRQQANPWDMITPLVFFRTSLTSSSGVACSMHSVTRICPSEISTQILLLCRTVFIQCVASFLNARSCHLRKFMSRLGINFQLEMRLSNYTV
jgi:hypothetical protein